MWIKSKIVKIRLDRWHTFAPAENLLGMIIMHKIDNEKSTIHKWRTFAPAKILLRLIVYYGWS